MKQQGPYGLRILSIIVLSVLSWALMILAIWMVGKVPGDRMADLAPGQRLP